MNYQDISSYPVTFQIQFYFSQNVAKFNVIIYWQCKQKRTTTLCPGKQQNDHTVN